MLRQSHALLMQVLTVGQTAAEPTNPATSALSALAPGYMAEPHYSATMAAFALVVKVIQMAEDTVPTTPIQIVKNSGAFAGDWPSTA